MTIVNTTFRAFVEKLGDTEAANFIGNEGDLFYDPNTASLRVSDGTTPGGVAVAGLAATAGGVAVGSVSPSPPIENGRPIWGGSGRLNSSSKSAAFSRTKP